MVRVGAPCKLTTLKFCHFPCPFPNRPHPPTLATRSPSQGLVTRGRGAQRRQSCWVEGQAQKLQLRRLLPSPFLDSAAWIAHPVVIARYLPSPAPGCIPSPRPREAQVSRAVRLGGGRTPSLHSAWGRWGGGGVPSTYGSMSPRDGGKRVCKRESMDVPTPSG